MEERGINTNHARQLWIATCLLVTIGIGTVIRRALIIGSVIAAGSGQGPNFDNGFHVPPALTLVHILPGLLFMILGPLQFMKGIRNRYKTFHRYSGWIFISASYIIGLSALLLALIFLPVVGIVEATGSVFFAVFFLFAVTKALLYILKKQIALHSEWMLRTFATGLAIATVRPVMALAFVISGLTPRQFLGTAFWIGFTLHLAGAETWINYTRRHKKPAREV